MMYNISGCFPSSGAATMNTLKNRISAGSGRPRVNDPRCSFCALCFADYKESAGVHKGVVVCADAAWMCCDDPVGVPEEVLPRGELRVSTERGYPPLQDGHRGEGEERDVDVARQVLYYYRSVNRVPPGTSRAVEGGGCRDRDVVFLPRNSFTIRLFPFHLRLPSLHSRHPKTGDNKCLAPSPVSPGVSSTSSTPSPTSLQAKHPPVSPILPPSSSSLTTVSANGTSDPVTVSDS